VVPVDICSKANWPFEKSAKWSLNNYEGQSTCCQRRSERVDDKGSDLLLSSDRGVGGVMVSKEEVAVGRKGSGGA
jgi:hypothetical protein